MSRTPRAANKNAALFFCPPVLSPLHVCLDEARNREPQRTVGKR
jgi:hypothetical protein